MMLDGRMVVVPTMLETRTDGLLADNPSPAPRVARELTTELPGVEDRVS